MISYYNFINNSLAKYLNTGDTPLFKKGDIFFNRNICSKKYTYIFEAQLSTIGVVQEITKESRGIGGTKLTDAHIQTLKDDNIEYVCQCLDPDLAGFKGMYRNAIKLYNAGISNKVAILPKPLDPMDLIQQKQRDKLYSILTKETITGLEYLVGVFEKSNRKTSKFKKTLLIEEFFRDVNIPLNHPLFINPKPFSLGWFINNHLKRSNNAINS